MQIHMFKTCATRGTQIHEIHILFRNTVKTIMQLHGILFFFKQLCDYMQLHKIHFIEHKEFRNTQRGT